MPFPRSCLVQQAHSGHTIHPLKLRPKTIFDSSHNLHLAHLPVCQLCLSKCAWNPAIYDHLHLDRHVPPFPWNTAVALAPTCSFHSLPSSWGALFIMSLPCMESPPEDLDCLLWTVLRSWLIWPRPTSPAHYQTPLWVFFNHTDLPVLPTLRVHSCLKDFTIHCSCCFRTTLPRPTQAYSFTSIYSLLRCHIVKTAFLTTLFK